jgi:cysteinyl-tRNA synthetase
MTSTREVAYDIVQRWKQDIGQVVKYDRMIADIDAALAQREAAVRAEERERAAEVAQCAQAVLTALNVGGVQSESLLHLKLREVMIAYRTAIRHDPAAEGEGR